MGMLGALFAGFAAAVIAWPLHRLLGRLTGAAVAVLAASLTAFFGMSASSIWEGDTHLLHYAWADPLGLSLAFRLDGLSLIFALLITAFGAVIFWYSGGYMKGRTDAGRFFSLMLLFMASMLGVALADNLLLLYVFWELTTVSSYLLIGFDHEKPAARRAAMQALVVTFSGGLALLAGILLLLGVAGSVDISYLLTHGAEIRAHPLYPAILVLILVGACAKSAQFPFHFWLPDAMEAPTPVSAYLHSVAMVKAGVYLLARLAPVLGTTDLWFYALTIVGGVTMLLGAVMGLKKTDLKQILAYATISVLGLLVLLLGLDTPEARVAFVAYFIAHAFYKCPLFLVAGSVDHETGTRDLLQLGKLGRAMPGTAAAGLLAALSMAGVPLFLGFVGKELVLKATEKAPYAVLLTAAFAGAAVLLFALAAAVGFRPFFARGGQQHDAHEAPPAMWIGPLLLALCGLGAGLFPSVLNSPITHAARASLQADPPEFHLTGVPGLNLASFISLGALAAGVVVFFLHGRLLKPRAPSALSLSAVYDRMMDLLDRTAHAQSSLLITGYLKHYLIAVIVSVTALVGYVLLRSSEALRWPAAEPVFAHEVILTAAILISVFAAVRAPSSLAAAAALGIAGAAIAVIFAFFGAPDLAMTQFIVEAVTVILLVLAVYHLPDFEDLTSHLGRVRDAVIAISAGALLSILVVLADVLKGAASISPYFIETARPQAHGTNVVNVILVDYRALDTMGEVLVLATAGAGVYALLRMRSGKREGG